MKEQVKGPNQDKRTNQEKNEDLRRDSGRQNASATRGGTTDLDEDALTVDRDRRQERGSGINTKREVTGSDFDGQLSGD